MTTNILKVDQLSVAYGGIKAVKGISLEVNDGELVTLIGANGAGKTTTLKAITGTLPDSKVGGHISYLGQPLKGQSSFELVKDKLAMVPEGRGVFTRMSIQENLLMGRGYSVPVHHRRRHGSLFRHRWKSGSGRSGWKSGGRWSCCLPFLWLALFTHRCSAGANGGGSESVSGRRNRSAPAGMPGRHTAMRGNICP
nr:ATP-binding cassette domain-containing protein [Herbaspirillum huttiense]